jgi:hypothetical protein
VPSHVSCAARRTYRLGTDCPVEMLERLFAFEALVLKNRHRTPTVYGALPLLDSTRMIPPNQSFVFLKRSQSVMVYEGC